MSKETSHPHYGIFTDENPLTLKEKILAFVIIICFPFFLIGLANIRLERYNRMQDRKELRNRLRHFKPKITKGFWGKKTTWTMRKTPLTEKELDELMKE